MKEWKKLGICIIIAVLIASFIGTVLGIVHNQLFVYSILQERNEDIMNVNEDFLDKIEKAESKEEIKNYIAIGKYSVVVQTFVSTAGVIKELFLYSILMGIITGILIYLIFIRKVKIKKILLISILVFISLFIITNIGEIISDIGYSIEEKMIDISLENYFSVELNLFFVSYLVVLLISYIVNFIYQKNQTKKLNKELKNDIIKIND